MNNDIKARELASSLELMAAGADHYGFNSEDIRILTDSATALERLSGRVRVSEEDVAKIVYDAMRWANAQATKLPPPEWVEGGNAISQDEARRAATRILAALEPAATPDAREKALREAAEIAGKYHDEAKRAILALISTGGSHE